MELNQELARLESQVPARQELPLQKNGEVERLAIALKEEKVFALPEESLKEVLRLVMVKVGLRGQDFPAEEEKIVLLAHIRREYGGHTLAEIRLAFEMAISNKLDLDQKDVICYGNFSCLYFSQIMNAYRKWACEEVKQLPKPIPESNSTEDLSDRAMEEWLQDVRSNILAGKTTVNFMPMMLYDYLAKKGSIAPSNAEKHDYLARAAEYRLADLAAAAELSPLGPAHQVLKEFAAMREAGEITGIHVDILKALAKKMILFDYLKKL